MDRRRFLKLFSAGTAVIATNPVHFLAPPGGWQRTESGLIAFANAPGTAWSSKTPEEIMKDVSEMLEKSQAYTCKDITMGFPAYSRILDSRANGLYFESDSDFKKRILENV